MPATTDISEGFDLDDIFTFRMGISGNLKVKRHLLHPDTLMVGGRYFNREIAIAADALKRDRREPLRYLFERTVRKLSRRFDPVLWEGEEKRLKKAEPLIDELDERLSAAPRVG